MTPRPTVIFPGLATGPTLEGAISDVASVTRASICGTGGGGLAPFLVRLSKNQKKQIVVLTQDSDSAKSLWEDLTYHSKTFYDDLAIGQTLLFPSFDYDPYDELAPDRRATIERARTLFQFLYIP